VRFLRDHERSLGRHTLRKVDTKQVLLRSGVEEQPCLGSCPHAPIDYVAEPIYNLLAFLFLLVIGSCPHHRCWEDI